MAWVGNSLGQPPNPVLLDGTAAAAIRDSAQTETLDPSGPSGVDNWGSTCPDPVSLEGWGYDCSAVHLWVRRVDANRIDLVACIDLFGHPGDMDADGGYLSGGADSCGAYPASCTGFEGEQGVFGPDEYFMLEILPDCTENMLLSFRLTTDTLFVEDNALGAGPPASSALGAQGTTWQAAPLIENGASIVGSPVCLDPTSRRGAVLFIVRNFDDFFANRPDLSPFLFQWRVIAATSGDNLTEDRVQGALYSTPDLRIQQSVTPPGTCGLPRTINLTVTNTGFVNLTALAVRDTLPGGLLYGGDVGPCAFGPPNVLGNVLEWSLGALPVGASRMCSFQVETGPCAVNVVNQAWASGRAETPCLPPGTVAAMDTARIACTGTARPNELIPDTLQAYFAVHDPGVDAAADEAGYATWGAYGAGSPALELRLETAPFADSTAFGIYNRVNPTQRFEIFGAACLLGWRAQVTFRANGIPGKLHVARYDGIEFVDSVTYVGADADSFGFYLDTSMQAGGGLYFSEDTLNGGDPRNLVYFGTGAQAATWWLTWEAETGLGNRDYADVILRAERIYPIARNLCSARGVTSVPPLLPVMPEGRRLHAYPNPMRGGAVFRLQTEADGFARLEIFDLAGRLVRSVYEGLLPAGAHEWPWDGRDAAGRPVMPGIYFYRALWPGGVERAKVAVLR